MKPRPRGIEAVAVDRVHHPGDCGQSRRQSPEDARLGRMGMHDVGTLPPEDPREREQGREITIGPHASCQRRHELKRHAEPPGVVVQDSARPAHQARSKRLPEMRHGVEGVLLRAAQLKESDHVADPDGPRHQAASDLGRFCLERSHSSRTKRVQIISS